MSSAKPILYSYFRSSCAWRVRIAMHLKGMDYEVRPVHLLRKDQLSPEFLRVNPMGQVPALLIDGLTLTQSLSIIEYVEETRKSGAGGSGVALLPKDAWQRAKVREICDCIASGIQPLQNLGVIMRYNPDDEAERTKWAQHYINHGFKALERLLAACAGKYCVGDVVSMADCCLVPQVYNAFRFKIDLAQYPTLNKLYYQLESEPAFKETHPLRQPDCPAELRATN